MDHVAPLVQTILWVGFLGLIFWYYHEIVGKLLAALHKRIEAGGAVKIGGIELTELQPQDTEQQKQKLEAEVKQASAADEPTGVNPSIQPPPAQGPISPTRYLRAEDLALRAIQAQYGVPVSRQLRAGDLEFDGFFVVEGTAQLSK
jgi:hypothetical protein